MEAAWRVRSIRSWWSARRSGGLSFEVLAYAAAPNGRARVEDHPSEPAVHVVAGCPTVDDAFSGNGRRAVRHLCIRHDPGNHDPVDALGYDGVGALIAFAHGVPNNAPRILYRRGHRWTPQFAARITSSARHHFSEDEKSAAAVEARLLELGQSRLARAGWLEKAKPHVRAILLVLSALSRPPRPAETLSRKTGLTVLEVRQCIVRAVAQVGLTMRVDSRRAAKPDWRMHESQFASSPLFQPSRKNSFYPKSLRAPVRSSAVDVGCNGRHWRRSSDRPSMERRICCSES